MADLEALEIVIGMNWLADYMSEHSEEFSPY